MKLSLIRRLGAALLLAAVAGHAAADDTIEQLRAENARLRTQLQQLQQLQQSCPAAAAPAASRAAAAAPAPATPAPPPATTPAAAASAVAPPAVVQVQAGAAPAGPAAVASLPVPAGYKLVPLAAPDYVDPLSPPYDRAGCSRDLFKGPVPAKWNEADNWLDVERGQNMADVEKSLGKEHFTAQGRGLVEWQYGKCGDRVAGRVLFQDGKVVSWQVPDLK